MSVITLTSDNFDEITGGTDGKILVDFWAPWCGPCRMLSPIVDELSEELDDVVVGKVNVDDEPALASKFGIMNIPTLLVMKDGEVVEKAIGVRPKSAILELLAD